MEIVPVVRSYHSPIDGKDYILRRNGNELTLHQVTSEGEKLVADKNYLYGDVTIMRRGYDSNGNMYRHSAITRPNKSCYGEFTIRDFRRSNPETLGTIDGFRLRGIEDDLGKIARYTEYAEKNIIPKFESWKDLGPLAKRYLAKAVEFAKNVK